MSGPHVYALEVVGNPIPQPRHKVAKNGNAYIDAHHPVHAYKHAIYLAAKATYRDPPLEGAIRLKLWFRLRRPGRPAQEYPSACDIDNLQKAVLDALNGVLWVDDRQIVAIFAAKEYAELPRMNLWLNPVDLKTWQT